MESVGTDANEKAERDFRWPHFEQFMALAFILRSLIFFRGTLSQTLVEKTCLGTTTTTSSSSSSSSFSFTYLAGHVRRLLKQSFKRRHDGRGSSDMLPSPSFVVATCRHHNDQTSPLGRPSSLSLSFYYAAKGKRKARNFLNHRNPKKNLNSEIELYKLKLDKARELLSSRRNASRPREVRSET